MKNIRNILFFTAALAVSAAAQVNITSPAEGATVGSPTSIVATASSTTTVTAMQIYVDNVLQYKVSGSTLNTSLPLASGGRYIVVKAWKSDGTSMTSSRKVTVSTATTSVTDPGSTLTAPSTAKVISSIEEMTGWEHCDSCAGAGGAGPTTPYSMKYGVLNPALENKSTEFWLGGDTSYSNALWWKQLGGNKAATNFVYDLYFYIKDVNASQALEFDVNQTVNARKYIWGTECNLRETKTWRIWDTLNKKWMNTFLPCATPKAYAWNRLTFEFQRDGNNVKYVSVTMNGTKQYFNKSYSSKAWTDVNELNVAFQMDGNKYQTDYSVWLDKVKLTYW